MVLLILCLLCSFVVFCIFHAFKRTRSRIPYIHFWHIPGHSHRYYTSLPIAILKEASLSSQGTCTNKFVRVGTFLQLGDTLTGDITFTTTTFKFSGDWDWCHHIKNFESKQKSIAVQLKLVLLLQSQSLYNSHCATYFVFCYKSKCQQYFDSSHAKSNSCKHHYMAHCSEYLN